MIQESTPIRTKENNILTFWEDVKEDGLASQKAGRQVFASVLMMRVQVAGDSKGTVEHEVETLYAEGYPHPIHGKSRRNQAVYDRYKEHIDSYKARVGQPEAVDGTPVEQAPFINRAQALNLKALGIPNVETLAELPEAGQQAIGMGGRKLVAQAKAFLESAANSQATMESQARERRLEERFAALEATNADLRGIFDVLPPEVQAQANAQLAASKRAGKKQAAA